MGRDIPLNIVDGKSKSQKMIDNLLFAGLVISKLDHGSMGVNIDRYCGDTLKLQDTSFKQFLPVFTNQFLDIQIKTDDLGLPAAAVKREPSNKQHQQEYEMINPFQFQPPGDVFPCRPTSPVVRQSVFEAFCPHCPSRWTGSREFVF